MGVNVKVFYKFTNIFVQKDKNTEGVKIDI